MHFENISKLSKNSFYELFPAKIFGFCTAFFNFLALDKIMGVDVGFLGIFRFLYCWRCSWKSTEEASLFGRFAPVFSRTILLARFFAGGILKMMNVSGRDLRVLPHFGGTEWIGFLPYLPQRFFL